MTPSEIDETTADPFCGFNLGRPSIGRCRKKIVNPGSTSSNRRWCGSRRNSGIVMSTKTATTFLILSGATIRTIRSPAGRSSCTAIMMRLRVCSAWVRRPHGGLFSQIGELILRVRDLVCANADNGVTKEAFRCYLVAHSMGGLVCLGCCKIRKTIRRARQNMDKFFTYATPHNGIDMAGINVPSWLSKGDMNNFNRERMTEYLDPNTRKPGCGLDP